MKTRLIFKWFDFWVGFFWDKVKRKIYIFPLPMVGIVIQLKPRCRLCDTSMYALGNEYFGCGNCSSNEKYDAQLNEYFWSTFQENEVRRKLFKDFQDTKPPQNL